MLMTAIWFPRAFAFWWMPFCCSLRISGSKKRKRHSAFASRGACCGLRSFFALPVSGLSLCAIIIAILALFGTNPKIAFRYFISLSAPILLVQGIIEIATCVSYVNIFAGIIGVVIAIALTFIASKFLLQIVKSNSLNYFSYYGFTVGGLTLIIGIIEIIVRK